MLDYDLIISDVDGVIVREGEPIWENIFAIRKLKEEGKKIILVTNNSGFSRVLLSRQLNYLGLEITPNDIITSGLSAAIYMKRNTKVKSVYVIGEEGLVEEMKNFNFRVLSTEEVEENNPDAVVLGLDRLVTYDKLSTGMRCVARGSMFIVTNMDRLWPSKDGLKLGAGALASSIIYALKREPDFIAGKPNKWIIQVAMELTGIKDLSKVLVIGDQLETDIKMGNDIGADTVLVLTGISRKEDIEKSSIKPKIVVENLSLLI
ncbi:HAD-superfamily hydrolase, subfamily IIA [Acidianus hospitalis W1]|uniref:HAD-superfamily hydrolase, subfamily IIA n=1 Tax=Acidianus hospitalis (strain W1) TaxID=933801 RepID=F4B905_ACIHW|nr:HAD-IIA family hydrolase [Acidianus hospitalis]AEE95028.1 HAD-superfamily hydrolase, subfamily IIA [Acidianus hospitalis W1]